MRTTAFIAALFISASFLSSSVDNAVMAVALAKPEPAQLLTHRAISKLRLLHRMKKRTLYKRAPQQRGKDNNEDDNENRAKDDDQNRNEDQNRNQDENQNRDADRNRDQNRGDDRNQNGGDRDDDRQNDNGKEREDGGKAKNDEDDERNAKNNRDPNEDAKNDDSEGENENPNAGVPADSTAEDSTAADNAAANETSASDDSELYNTGPSSVNTKGVQNGTVIAAVAVGGLLLIGASIIVFMRRRKHADQTEAIIEKSASAFVQQNSVYESLDDPPPIGTFSVISTFAPNLPDELNVDLGDSITVLVEYDDGWVQGVNETRGGTKGVMPRHCLNMSSKYGMNKRSSSIGFANVNLG